MADDDEVDTQPGAVIHITVVPIGYQISSWVEEDNRDRSSARAKRICVPRFLWKREHNGDDCCPIR